MAIQVEEIQAFYHIPVEKANFIKETIQKYQDESWKSIIIGFGMLLSIFLDVLIGINQ